jgi:electron transport protein HydN
MFPRRPPAVSVKTPCANVCPNGAISRDKGFVHVMQERCIGCKTCVVACPYGAMEVVVRR